MSKKKKYRKSKPRTQPQPQRLWWLWVVAAVAVVLVGSSLALLLFPTSSEPETGVPKVVVDNPIIDEGYQPLDKIIRTSFTLRNEGEASLRILGEPQVELVEGC